MARSTATKSAPKPAAKAVRPARKGTARTSAGKAAPVATRKLSRAEAKAGTAKLGKPTPRRAAVKPAPRKTKNATVPARVSATADPKTVARVVKLRRAGTPWSEVAETTGLSLSALARMRKANGGRDGFLA